MNLLLFSGTTEGRLLAEALAELPVRATVCVATDYGSEVLDNLRDRFDLRVGRLDAAAIGDLLRSGRYDCVVDATHPYAAEATANIRAAAAAAGVPRHRLRRAESPAERRECFASAADVARALAETRGNVLLATGSRDLAAFAAVPDFAERMYPRVLPAVESIQACERLGYRRGHIIAMQGPFGRELNAALFRHFRIAVLVTKESGAEGGFPEKLLAAGDAGVRVMVIGRPPEDDGVSREAILAAIGGMLEAET